MKDFAKKLEAKLKKQIKSQRVGFLLGAGASYLEGKGYPLAEELWPKIKDNVSEKEREEIQEKLNDGAEGLEKALDLLDMGGVDEGPHRHSVVNAIAGYFGTVEPPLDHHKNFVAALSLREEAPIPIFALNYDPLLERAAELAHVRLYDGFHGHEHSFFDPPSFRHNASTLEGSWRGPRPRQVTGAIKLIKLHGSLGWYDSPETGIRRCMFNNDIPDGARRLMIPPQHRKAQDTGRPPYSTLWSEFRGALFHGDKPLNRLVAIGYGMADEHVNAEIESALARHNFTLIIITKALSDPSFERWSKKSNTIIITENCCSLNGENGPGHPTLWSFEGAVQELSR